MPETAVWLANLSLAKLLELTPALTRRERRLFGAACLRRAAAWVPHPSLADIVGECERHADAPGDSDELEWARDLAFEFTPAGYHDDELADLYELHAAVNELLDDAPDPALIAALCARSLSSWWPCDGGEAMFQADLFLDIVGNPFRPVTLDPTWLTPVVAALARIAHRSGDYADLPILADALEDAGCDAAPVLDHLRAPGYHVRGCWAVDLVLNPLDARPT